MGKGKEERMSQPEEYDDLRRREELTQENHLDHNSYGEESVQPEDSQNNRQEMPQDNRVNDNDVDPYMAESAGRQPSQAGGSYSMNPHYSPYGGQHAQGGSPYQNPYGGQQVQPNRFNDHPYQGNFQSQNSGFQGQNPYVQMPGNGANQYSPYAGPARTSNMKLIVGIVAGIIILFLIAVFALTYKAVSLFTEERERIRRNNFEEHEFNDNREKNREERRQEDVTDPYDDFDYGYDYYDDQDDYYNDYFYEDDYDYDNDQYYTLHDDIKENLSYSVEFDYYEYDTDFEDVAIVVSYPVIKGNQVPNLDHLNELIQSEVDLFKDYYEEEYADLMGEEGSYFSALSSGYVTYMDEEKLSIAFSEYIYTNDYRYAYLYSINIDMENGVVLDNENILGVDDDFSVEFRRKSDIQNGEIAYLTAMTDQEITDYFNSPDIIVFYTPQGMEIGFNYEAGWVTVTYEEFEQYLKVF